MKRKTEKAYFNEEWNDMVGHLNSFIKTGNQDELHQFRVQVKKLRAMLILLDAVSSKNKLTRDFKPVRKIFKQCGLIREAYINMLLTSRYKLNDEEFILGQVNEMEKNILSFKKLAKKHLKTIKSAHADLEHDLKAVDDDSVNEFYKRQLEQIASRLNELQFNESLHDCRKQIKNLVYNRKIAQKALDGKLEIDNDYLDKLQDRIGNWHDNELAMELFSALEKNKPLITKIKRQNTRLKKSINVLAKDFWGKATLEPDAVKA